MLFDLLFIFWIQCLLFYPRSLRKPKPNMIWNLPLFPSLKKGKLHNFFPSDLRSAQNNIQNFFFSKSYRSNIEEALL